MICLESVHVTGVSATENNGRATVILEAFGALDRGAMARIEVKGVAPGAKLVGNIDARTAVALRDALLDVFPLKGTP